MTGGAGRDRDRRKGFEPLRISGIQKRFTEYDKKIIATALQFGDRFNKQGLHL